MSNVVAFRPDRKGRPHSGEPGEAGARILFFTGIRYMRAEDADQDGDGAARDAAAPSAESARIHPGLDKAERLKA